MDEMEKQVKRALKAKKSAEERWGKFEMQAEKAETAGPSILRAHASAKAVSPPMVSCRTSTPSAINFSKFLMSLN